MQSLQQALQREINIYIPYVYKRIKKYARKHIFIKQKKIKNRRTKRHNIYRKQVQNDSVNLSIQ